MQSGPLHCCLCVAFALPWLKERLSAASNLVAREVLEVCALNPTDPARKNSCLSGQLDNLSIKPLLQRKTNWVCHCWMWADTAEALLCKKNVKGLLAKVNVAEGGINTIKFPSD